MSKDIVIKNKIPSSNEDKVAGKLKCGIIMPISAIDGCPAEHWLEVKTIIADAIEAIEKPDFDVKLVSDADDVGVIHKRIVQNLYDSDVIVCDVSAKNPNVMFELGMRLAFDKPTILIKDDKTDYVFDTGVIDHISYPRDLRFSRVISFKEDLKNKVIGTYKKSKEGGDGSSFLKNFGKFTVANLQEDVISADKAVIEMLGDMQKDIAQLSRRFIQVGHSGEYWGGKPYKYLDGPMTSEIDEVIRSLIMDYIHFNKIDSPLGLRSSESITRFVKERISPSIKRYFKSERDLIEVVEKVAFDVSMRVFG